MVSIQVLKSRETGERDATLLHDDCGSLVASRAGKTRGENLPIGAQRSRGLSLSLLCLLWRWTADWRLRRRPSVAMRWIHLRLYSSASALRANATVGALTCLDGLNCLRAPRRPWRYTPRFFEGGVGRGAGVGRSPAAGSGGTAPATTTAVGLRGAGSEKKPRRVAQKRVRVRWASIVSAEALDGCKVDGSAATGGAAVMLAAKRIQGSWRNHGGPKQPLALDGADLARTRRPTAACLSLEVNDHCLVSRLRIGGH